VKGFPVATIVNGKIVMLDGQVNIEGTGQPLDF
jgi:dihydroorotase-like cyclic amidohydrolase